MIANVKIQNMLLKGVAVLLISLFLLQVVQVSLLPDAPSGPFSPGQVRGASFIARGETYTLNFEQQRKTLASLEESEPYPSPNAFDALPLEKILIHRFHRPDIEIFPVAIRDSYLLFRCPELGEGIFKEKQPNIVLLLSEAL